MVAAFVALDAGGVIAGGRAASGDQVGGGKMVIELCGRQGDRMRVEVEGSRGVVDVAGLVDAFWSRA